MKEIKPPAFRPSEDLWAFCEKVAEKYDRDPFNVLKKLVYIGKVVANIQEVGGEVRGLIGGKTIPIDVFEDEKSLIPHQKVYNPKKAVGKNKKKEI